MTAMTNNELLNCVERDMLFWLSKNEENTIKYVMQKGIIEIIDNISHLIKFDRIKKNFNKCESIHYGTRKYTTVIIILDAPCNVTRIYFYHIRKYHYHHFIPWIEIKDNNYMDFCYYRPDNKIKQKKMGCISSVSEMYSVAKNIDLEIVADIHKDKIATYYASLPLFKVFLYIFGEPSDLIQKEIVIEI